MEKERIKNEKFTNEEAERKCSKGERKKKEEVG